MIIDFHTHIFPDKLAVKAIKSLELSGNIKAKSDGTLNGLKKSMKKFNIDYSVVLPIATKPEQCKSINDFSMKMNDKPNIIAFGSVHPLYEDWKQELIRLKQIGIRGIKIHPDFQGMYIDDYKMIDVIEQAAKLDFIIVIHCGKDISFSEVHCTPQSVANVAGQIKNAKIVAAHMGGYDYLDEAEKYVIGSNMFIDVSFVLGRFENNQVCRMLENHSPDRIFFGSDSPWDSQGENVERLMKLSISDKLREKILYANAQKILGIR